MGALAAAPWLLLTDPYGQAEMTSVLPYATSAIGPSLWPWVNWKDGALGYISAVRHSLECLLSSEAEQKVDKSRNLLTAAGNHCNECEFPLECRFLSKMWPLLGKQMRFIIN